MRKINNFKIYFRKEVEDEGSLGILHKDSLLKRILRFISHKYQIVGKKGRYLFLNSRERRDFQELIDAIQANCPYDTCRLNIVSRRNLNFRRLFLFIRNYGSIFDKRYNKGHTLGKKIIIYLDQLDSC